MNDFEHTLAGGAIATRSTKTDDSRIRIDAPRQLYRARRQRGVTLVEVLIVVAIIAMVASGVAVVALPKFREAQIKTAETGARTIRQAVMSWQMTSNETTCPTVSQLVQDKELDSAANTKDPWGRSYQVICTDDGITVTSVGPDGKKGTKDDISVPKNTPTGNGSE